MMIEQFCEEKSLKPGTFRGKMTVLLYQVHARDFITGWLKMDVSSPNAVAQRSAAYRRRKYSRGKSLGRNVAFPVLYVRASVRPCSSYS